MSDQETLKDEPASFLAWQSRAHRATAAGGPEMTREQAT